MQLGGIALMMVVSSAVHAAHPRDAPLCSLVRGLHAWTWLFAGVWAVHMAGFMYIFNGKRGVHHLLFEDEEHMHAEEVGGWYLAIDAWLSAAVLVLPLVCCPAKSANLSSVADEAAAARPEHTPPALRGCSLLAVLACSCCSVPES